MASAQRLRSKPPPTLLALARWSCGARLGICQSSPVHSRACAKGRGYGPCAAGCRRARDRLKHRDRSPGVSSPIPMQ